MGYYTTAEIVKIVNKLIDRCGTRDPYKVAKELGINIIYRDFEKQRGAYKVILKNRFVFLKNGMHPVVEQIVLWHEIGHDVLHRQEAVAVGGFKEFNIFDMRENRMEYEANIFASQASLPDDTILEYIENGYDIQQIARAMCSDINLIALKVDTLIAQGYQLRKNGMHPVVEQIVLWHEIGHDVLHRQEAVAVGGFKEFNIFDMRENRMEYEANIFASQASLPDDTILEYIENGYDIQQIARAMCSDINLIALKVDTLIAQGYQLRKQEHQNDFLKYSKKI